MFYVFQSEEHANNALNIVNQNFGFPDGNGTVTWCTVKKAHNQDLWFFRKPDNNEKCENVVVFQIWGNIESLLPPNNLNPILT